MIPFVNMCCESYVLVKKHFFFLEVFINKFIFSSNKIYIIWTLCNCFFLYYFCIYLSKLHLITKCIVTGCISPIYIIPHCMHTIHSCDILVYLLIFFLFSFSSLDTCSCCTGAPVHANSIPLNFAEWYAERSHGNWIRIWSLRGLGRERKRL